MTQMHAGSSWSVSGEVRVVRTRGGCQRLRPVGPWDASESPALQQHREVTETLEE
jgi:hypothetical protein